RETAEFGQDIAARHALDAVGGLAAAAAVILEIVGHGLSDRMWPRGCGTAACKPLLMRPPGSRLALRLREVEDGIAIGVLQVVGKRVFGPAVVAALVAPPGDPCPAGTAAAVADMESLLDHAPVRFGAGRKAQARAARCQSCLADGAGHQMSR